MIDEAGEWVETPQADGSIIRVLVAPSAEWERAWTDSENTRKTDKEAARAAKKALWDSMTYLQKIEALGEALGVK